MNMPIQSRPILKKRSYTIGKSQLLGITPLDDELDNGEDGDEDGGEESADMDSGEEG